MSSNLSFVWGSWGRCVRCVLKAVAFMRLWGQVCLEGVWCVLKGVKCFLKFVVFMGLLGQVSPVCLERCRFYEALGVGVS